NIGTKTEPKLAEGKVLVAESPMTKNWEAGLKDGQWGTRAKIWVVDWNNDGWPDLLMGDFGSARGQEPQLTEADREVRAKAETRRQEVLKPSLPLIEKQKKLLKPAPNETPQEAKQRQEALRRIQEEMRPVAKEYSEASQALVRFRTPYNYVGNVWLFL